MPSPKGSLPDDAEARNGIPMADGLLYYFPNALAAVAAVSKAGNDQHNPGQPMHWSRGKSTDHANKIMRHLVDAGGKDSKGIRHSAYMAWRALALLQEEIERDEGAPMPRNAKPVVDHAAEIEALRRSAAKLCLGMGQDRFGTLDLTGMQPPYRSNPPKTNTGD